jgi:hypothetical protein
VLRALLWLLVFLTVLMATELRPSQGEPRMGAVAFSSGSDQAISSRLVMDRVDEETTVRTKASGS